MVQPTPLRGICSHLEADYGVQMVFDKDLGDNNAGTHKIMGFFRSHPMTIFIDRSLVESPPMFNFTLAHELGHLCLHRNLDLDVDPDALQDTVRSFVTGHRILRQPLDWLEWQANRFAGSLLMPLSTLRDALETVQADLDISKRGYIRLDHQQVNQKDYRAISQKLMRQYVVSASVVRVRLEQLGILIDHRTENVSHISQLFRTKKRE